MDGIVFEHHWNREDFRYLDGFQPGDRLHFIYRGFLRGVIDPVDATWQVISLLNRDDRPSGLLGPSYSGGDVIALWDARTGEFIAAYTSNGLEVSQTPLTEGALNVLTERALPWVRHEESSASTADLAEAGS